MTARADIRPAQSPAAASRPPQATAPAEQVLRRMLLRRGCAVPTETARLVAECLLALYQASPAQALQALFQAGPPARSPARPRQRRPGPAGGCDPLF
jgi:hypothetical protein